MSKTSWLPGVLLLASCAGTPVEEAVIAEPSYRGYACVRADVAPVIDGKLDEAVWERAAWSADYVDIRGDEGPEPWFRTRMKMLWDDTYFYVAADMEEPHLWGTLTKRDSVIYHDNDFEVFIDPDGDTHHYYELEINALGTVWDLFLVKPYRDGGPAIHAWDIAGLKTAVHLDGTLNDPSDEDVGWSVEIAIPWDVLKEAAGRRVPPQEGDTWRMNFSRVQWDLEVVDGAYRKVEKPKELKHPEHNWVWTPQGVIAMHQPETWGKVLFLGEPPSRAFRTNGDVIELPPWEEEWGYLPEEVWRHRLFLVYHAQRAYRAEHGRWAGSADELAIPVRFATPEHLSDLGFPLDAFSWPPTIEAGEFRWDAWIDGWDGSRLHLREDGRIRLVKPE